MTFIIASLKRETCSLMLRLLTEDSQLNRRNATQFFHEEDGRKPSNRILHKLLDGDNYNVTKDELQSPLSY